MTYETFVDAARSVGEDRLLEAFRLGFRERLTTRDIQISYLARSFGIELRPYRSVSRVKRWGKRIIYHPEMQGWWWHVLTLIFDAPLSASDATTDIEARDSVMLRAFAALGYLTNPEQLHVFTDQVRRQQYWTNLPIPEDIGEMAWTLFEDQLLASIYRVKVEHEDHEQQIAVAHLKGTVAIAGARSYPNGHLKSGTHGVFRNTGGYIPPQTLIHLLEEGHLIIEPQPLIRLDTTDPWIDLGLGDNGELWTRWNWSGGSARQEGQLALAERAYERVPVKLVDDQPLLLYPGQSMNMNLRHYIQMPPDIQAMVDGRSTWAQRGISVAKASQFKAGWSGIGVLEITHDGWEPVELRVNELICQMAFVWIA